MIDFSFIKRGFTRVSAYIDWIRTNANEKRYKSTDNRTLSLELSSYATALNKLGRLDEAYTKANVALALNARNQMAISQKREAENGLKYKRSKDFNLQGVELFDKGDYEKANELFATAHDIAPLDYTKSRSTYRSNQASALNKLRRYREALIIANEALKLNNENKRAHEERTFAERGNNPFGRILNFFG